MRTASEDRRERAHGDGGRVRVLIVDDSPLVQGIFVQQLSEDPGIEVVGTAPDPYVARNLIVELAPDVVVMDIRMPKMDGLTFLKKLMRYYPIPVIIVSSFAREGGSLAIQALAHGAVEVICKSGSRGLKAISEELKKKIKVASRMRVKALLPPEPASKRVSISEVCKSLDRFVLIGASTGGTEAIKALLANMPADGPGVVIVQHMLPEFTGSFAEYLNSNSPMEVREAQDGDFLQQGRVLLGPGTHHMVLRATGNRYRVHLKAGPLVNGHRPSVDVLFKSGARELGSRAIGALLTGMGRDGAQGLLEMRQSGARTLAQDEESCVIFGMPKEAIELDAAEQVVSLQRMPEVLLKLVET